MNKEDAITPYQAWGRLWGDLRNHELVKRRSQQML